MRRIVVSFITFSILLSASPVSSAAAPITRRDGFLVLWASIDRPTEKNGEKPFADVRMGERGYEEIRYAKYRGILDDDEESFRPDASLLLTDALVWLFRTRSVDDIDVLTAEHLPDLLARYPIARLLKDGETDPTVTEDALLSLMRTLDGLLAEEIHEVSLYAEKFHGKGTAFGETFDMDALTAAHRTFPYNTLVRVTNVTNGKTVTVRINDRGPYVDGRDMDLSKAAFESIGLRMQGVLHATFQRLGDANRVGACSAEPRYQSRITKDVRLLPGIPHALKLGGTLVLRSPAPFVVRQVRYPDGNVNAAQDWVLAGAEYRFVPSVPGDYVFTVGSKEGRRREMTMKVVDCST